MRYSTYMSFLPLALLFAPSADAIQQHEGRATGISIGPDGGRVVRSGAGAGDQAINAAVAAACAGRTDRTLHIPAGVHELRQPIVLSCGLTLVGDGDSSVFHPAPGIDAIISTTAERVQVQNLAITYSAPAAEGTDAIRCDVPKGSSATGLTIRDVTINNANTGISISNCPFFIISSNRIFSFGKAGVSISNATNVDVGDGVIENNSIFNFKPIQDQIGVTWASGGGVRIVNNKFGALYGGVQVELASNAMTSQIFVQSNSFDTMNGYGMQLTRAGEAGGLSDILWNGNVCTSCVRGLSIPTDRHGPWVNNVVVTGNTFIGKKQPGVVAFALDSARDLLVSDNSLFSNHEDSRVISLGSAVSGAIVGPMVAAGKWTKSENRGANVNMEAGHRLFE